MNEQRNDKGNYKYRNQQSNEAKQHIIAVLWIGLEIVMATHTKTSGAAKRWTMDIVGYTIGMLKHKDGIPCKGSHPKNSCYHIVLQSVL